MLTSELDILIASAPENHRVSGLSVEQPNSRGGLNVNDSAPIKGCDVCGPALKHKSSCVVPLLQFHCVKKNQTRSIVRNTRVVQ